MSTLNLIIKSIVKYTAPTTSINEIDIMIKENTNPNKNNHQNPSKELCQKTS